MRLKWQQVTSTDWQVWRIDRPDYKLWVSSSQGDLLSQAMNRLILDPRFVPVERLDSIPFHSLFIFG